MSIKLNRILINESNENEKILEAMNFDNSIKEKVSFIFSDPKGELFKLSKEALEREGYRIEEINICEEYNPLDIIVSAYENGNLEEAITLCQDLTYTIYYRPKGELFWQESVMSLVNALILAVIDNEISDIKFLGEKKKEIKEKITLEKIVEALIDIEIKDIEEYFTNLSNDNIAKKEYFKVDFQNCKDKEYIIQYALSELLKYKKTKQKTFINLNDLNYIGFRNEKDNRPVALFIKELDNMPFSNALISIFIRQLYYVLSNYEDGICDREVNFIIKNISQYPIKNLDVIFSVSIARRIFFNLIVEHLYEIKSVYGKDISDIILNNCVVREEEPVIALGFTRAGLGVDYKGNAINDDMSFINENFKIEK